MNHFLVIFCCRIDVMSTASHIVGTRPYTALVAEVRWRQCGCCWRVELTVASRTTTMTPQWWWPRTKKWVRRWQRGKTINIMDMKFHCYSVVPFILFYGCMFLLLALENNKPPKGYWSNSKSLPYICPDFQSLSMILLWEFTAMCYIIYVRKDTNSCKTYLA